MVPQSNGSSLKTKSQKHRKRKGSRRWQPPPARNTPCRRAVASFFRGRLSVREASTFTSIRLMATGIEHAARMSRVCTWLPLPLQFDKRRYRYLHECARTEGRCGISLYHFPFTHRSTSAGGRARNGPVVVVSLDMTPSLWS
jgi:hypothetical protein